MESSKRIKRTVKKIGNSKGELLIESMASFVILIIVIIAATGMIFAAINMNRNADAKSEQLGTAIKAVENGGKAESTNSGTMTMSFDGHDFSKNITIKTQENIVYFSETSN